MAHPVRCQCGNPNCHSWHVSPQAAVQGVHFTYKEAVRVAAALNSIGPSDPRVPRVGVIGFWANHDCSYCHDGNLLCLRGNHRNCEYPHARND